MDSIEFSANKDGSIKIERKIAGIVTDRFNAPKHIGFFACKRKDAWIGKAIGYLMQPSAGIVIEVPVMPPLQLSQSEVLERVVAQLHVSRKRLADIDSPDLTAICGKDLPVMEFLINAEKQGITADSDEAIANLFKAYQNQRNL